MEIVTLINEQVLAKNPSLAFVGNHPLFPYKRQNKPFYDSRQQFLLHTVLNNSRPFFLTLVLSVLVLVSVSSGSLCLNGYYIWGCFGKYKAP